MVRECAERKPEPELDGLELRLERGADGQLWASTGLGARPVHVRRCFPWTAPARFVSLRDADGDEVALVRDLDELDADSRGALEASLAEAGFVLEIEAVDAVEDEVEIRAFRVRTRQGARRFQTLRDEWPRALPGGAILLRDVAGDLYLVRDPAALDPASRALLAPLVD